MISIINLLNEELNGKNPCWRGYEPIGTKEKDGKEVPNCVPIDEQNKPDLRQIKKGLEVEMEHTSNKKVALKIALDHLAEDPNYYDKLQIAGLEEELNEGEFCSECLKEYIQQMSNLMLEAEYKGRKVPLGKPMKGDVKKFKVYVKNKKGKVIKVNFGQKGVKIKKSNPKRRKSFRARHKCHTAKDRTTPRYWSCRKW